MTEPDRIMACLEVGKLLTSTHNLDDILELIMQKASQLIEARNWSLLLQEPETGELTFSIVKGENKDMLEGVRLKPGDSIASHVTETGVLEIMSNVKGDKRFNVTIDKITGFNTKSIVCVPLNVQGKTLGVIEVINVNDLESFNARDLPILTILADYAAIAIENSHYIARIRKMNISDEYTGLYNARYLHQVLEELIIHANRSKTPIAVVFVDIDNFKTVVDTCGHLSGTHLLKEIGETISSCLEEKDILVKYGGDEYVIILPDTDRQEAVSRLENVLQSIRSSTYLTSEETPVTVTASFGVAIYPEDAATKKDILIAADNSMYKVKKSSKNGIGMS
jgi:diguanylate cyclase (GGDEF)-like protein